MFKKLVFYLILLLLLFVSFFPRSIEVLNGNPVFEIDQGRDLLAVKSIVVDKKLTLIGAELGAGQAGLQYLFHGPGYFYLLSISFILFNGNPVGGVVLMLLFGLGAIAFSIFLLKKLLGFKEGIVMGFLVALCPFFIGQSRFFENHYVSTFFILLVFYFVYRFTKKQQEKWFVFLAAFTSASIYNLETAVAIPLFVTVFVYSIFLYKKKILKVLPLLLFGLILGFTPAIIFEARHGFLGIKGVINYIFVSHPSHSSSPTILIHAKNIYNLFVFSFSDSFPGRLIFPAQNILLAFIFLFGFAFYKEKNRIIKNFLLFLILLFPVNFLIFILLRNIIFQHYIIDLFLAYLLFFTFILSWFYKNKNYKIAGIIFAYFIFIVFIGTQSAYKVSIFDYKDYGGAHKLKGKLEAIDFIYKDANKNNFGLLVFYPPIYTYPYDYLIWWYGQKKYNYVPHNDKKGTFYLLIEKDVDKPWSYIGWEETVVKTGKVVFTKTLPRSGIIVEKRIAE